MIADGIRFSQHSAHFPGIGERDTAGLPASVCHQTDHSPAGLAKFSGAPAIREIDVLIYNAHKEGSGPRQIRSSAERSGVPVVEPTEAVAQRDSFVGSQLGRLTAAGKALNVSQ